MAPAQTKPLETPAWRTAPARGGGDKDKLSFEGDPGGTLNAASAAEIDGAAGIDSCHAVGSMTGFFNCERMA